MISRTVDNNRYWNRSSPHTNLGQLKTDRSIGITVQDPVPIGISAEFESKVLTPCHALVIKQRLHWNALQQQLNVSCVDAPWNEFQKSSMIFFIRWDCPFLPVGCFS
jgi:hypothetical protein